MLKPFLGTVLPAGPRGRLSILIFHRVLAEPDPLFPDEMHAQRFDELCGWVRSWFNVLPLREGARRLQEGTLPPRALAITFDDGYADNASIAWPILQRHRLPATCFVATAYLDGGCMWNDRVVQAVRDCGKQHLRLPMHGPFDGAELPLMTVAERRRAIDFLLGRLKYLAMAERDAAADALMAAAGTRAPGDLMMSTPQLQKLAASGMDIGGHTRSHPILARLDDAAAAEEIRGGKQDLENALQRPVEVFAYPNGKPGVDYTRRDVGLVAGAGFAVAVSTAWGAARRGSDPLQLPRFTPWDRAPLPFAARMARNVFHRPVYCEPLPGAAS